MPATPLSCPLTLQLKDPSWTFSPGCVKESGLRANERGEWVSVSMCVCFTGCLVLAKGLCSLFKRTHSLAHRLDLLWRVVKGNGCKCASLCVCTRHYSRVEERDVFCSLPGESAGQLDFYRFYHFLILCAAKKGDGGVSCARSGALAALLSHGLIFCMELSCISSPFLFLRSAALEFNWTWKIAAARSFVDLSLDDERLTTKPCLKFIVLFS